MLAPEGGGQTVLCVCLLCVCSAQALGNPKGLSWHLVK